MTMRSAATPASSALPSVKGAVPAGICFFHNGRLAVFLVACQSVEPVAWPAASLPMGPQPQKLRGRGPFSRNLHFAGARTHIARR
jgi:hypothetical protein